MMVTVAKGYDLDYEGAARWARPTGARGTVSRPRRPGSRRAPGEAQAADSWACRMPAGGTGAVQPAIRERKGPGGQKSGRAPAKYSRENARWIYVQFLGQERYVHDVH